MVDELKKAKEEANKIPNNGFLSDVNIYQGISAKSSDTEIFGGRTSDAAEQQFINAKKLLAGDKNKVIIPFNVGYKKEDGTIEYNHWITACVYKDGADTKMVLFDSLSSEVRESVKDYHSIDSLSNAFMKALHPNEAAGNKNKYITNAFENFQAKDKGTFTCGYWAIAAAEYFASAATADLSNPQTIKGGVKAKFSDNFGINIDTAADRSITVGQMVAAYEAKAAREGDFKTKMMFFERQANKKPTPQNLETSSIASSVGSSGSAPGNPTLNGGSNSDGATSTASATKLGNASATPVDDNNQKTLGRKLEEDQSGGQKPQATTKNATGKTPEHEEPPENPNADASQNREQTTPAADQVIAPISGLNPAGKQADDAVNDDLNNNDAKFKAAENEINKLTKEYIAKLSPEQLKDELGKIGKFSSDLHASIDGLKKDYDETLNSNDAALKKYLLDAKMARYYMKVLGNVFGEKGLLDQFIENADVSTASGFLLTIMNGLKAVIDFAEKSALEYIQVVKAQKKVDAIEKTMTEGLTTLEKAIVEDKSELAKLAAKHDLLKKELENRDLENKPYQEQVDAIKEQSELSKKELELTNKIQAFNKSDDKTEEKLNEIIELDKSFSKDENKAINSQLKHYREIWHNKDSSFDDKITALENAGEKIALYNAAMEKQIKGSGKGHVHDASCGHDHKEPIGSHTKNLGNVNKGLEVS